ncbi:MAG: ATP-dependent helicase [Lewinellaceae bacterium]|nr:ATP-dependent helicase [Saprospiraceae bacterium]MCB9338434.1 ATP-dependent helicase [Lewinellaceae bacterium]
MPWSDNLDINSAAYDIAASPNPSLRVIAGPGTGKSFAMKRRVARLLEEGEAASSILPVTFTRVAAEDLHRELVGMGVEGCEDIQGVTLHSLSFRILMRNHVLQVTGRTPRPLNEFEIKVLEADLQDQHGGIRAVRRKIKAYEAAWARLQIHQPGYALSPDDRAFEDDLLGWMRFHRAMLIGEVIPQVYEYLRLNPLAPERTEFAHILVDEYQDLNRAEQGVIQFLSEQAQVCIVGDDDQSIYSFKHAHPEGIRNWHTTRPNTHDITLGECRRCPVRVTQMANSLISHNQSRPQPRSLTPIYENGEGDVRIIQYDALDREVRGVADLITSLLGQGYTPGEILVLAQRGVIGTPIYNELVGRAIPVKSYYAEAELDAEETQKRFALLKLFVNRDDRVALRWLLGLNSNNWRAPAYKRVREYCEQHGMTPWACMSQLEAGTLRLSHTQQLVAQFRELISDLETLSAYGDFSRVIDDLFPDGDESVRDLRTLALRTIEEIGTEDPVIFLTELSSAISQPDIPLEIEEVRIMSLHKSKGLSSPVTIIAGCVDGLLPKQPDTDLTQAEQDADLEEQRRLFYVGITRVKSIQRENKPGTLILTYSRYMAMANAMGAGITPATLQNGVALLHASRFISELGPYAPNPIGG